MAFTVTINKVIVHGDRKEVFGTLTPDSSWTAAGEPLTKAELKLEDELNQLQIDPKGGYVFQYDKANSVVLGYRQKDPGNAGGADIPLPAIANSVDLSAQVIPFVAIGKGTAAA